MNTWISFSVLDQLTGGQLGTLDVQCPLCGPDRQHPVNRRRKVMRVWRHTPEFAGFHCARCGQSGYARKDAAIHHLDRVAMARARAEIAARDQQRVVQQHRKAVWLWRHRLSITGTVAETYLREVRKYRGQVPPTLGFLHARGANPPAMIAAFGLVEEPEPGVIAIGDDAVMGVHITKLRADGSDKADTKPNKIMIGRLIGSPIILAPVNDLLGLAVCEGIEDALSVHEETGLGAWAAGAASRLPALADSIPSFAESLSVLIDDVDAGRHHAAELVRRASERGIEVRRLEISRAWGKAA